MVVPGTVVNLDREEARHVVTVLRGRPGMEVVLADGNGMLASAVVRSVARGRVEVEAVAFEHVRPERPGGITVALGVLHSRAMDWAVQKSVEVGVVRLVPLLAARTQLGSDAARGRLAHWRRLALQAIKQCHRPWAMEVADPQSLEVFVAGSLAGCVADADGARVTDLAGDRCEVLVVGPEGGLDRDERSLLDSRGWQRLCLGRHTLRAETAAVVGAAMLGACR
jgi:16S rRNA (uracil1498-N3)-methyltransferase